MRTNAMYPFVNLNADEVDADIAAIYTSVTGKAKPTGADLLFCRLLSSVVLYNAANVNFAANQNLASRASGENLDALAEIYYQKTRPEPAYAGCMMEFTISEEQEFVVLIPGGTRVTNAEQTIVFATDEDVYVAIGETTATVHATCTTVGKEGNGLAIGEICECVDLFTYYASCTNTDISGGGTDEMTDDEFYDLLLQSQDAYSTCGSESAYIYFAKKASSEIADVVVNSPAAGTVRIYCLMNDGTIAGAEEKALVTAQCNASECRPLTDQVIVSDPDYHTYSITMTYYLRKDTGMSTTDLVAAIEDAVAEYAVWQCGKLGRDIVPDELITRVLAAGAKRCVITSPVYTVLRKGEVETPVVLADTVPEVAKCTGVTLTNGGYEE